MRFGYDWELVPLGGATYKHQRDDSRVHEARTIALQSAVGGMALSVIGMLIAAFGYLPPVAGAVTQEVIDLVVVLNALRVAAPPSVLTDY